MELDKLPRRQQRLLALTILAGLLIVAYLVFVLPFMMMSDSYEERIDRLSRHLAGSRQILAEGSTAKEQLRQVALAERRNGYYLESDRPALAAAELQRRIKQIVEQFGGSIVSSQAMGGKEDNGLRTVVLRVNMRMDLPSFEKILYSLQSQPPVLMLDNVTIVARPSGSTARWSGSAAAQQELDASMDLMGYIKGGNDTDT